MNSENEKYMKIKINLATIILLKMLCYAIKVGLSEKLCFNHEN